MRYPNPPLKALSLTLTLACLGLAALLAVALAAVSATAAPAGTLIVTNTADGGPGSLRQAIADAQPGDSIEFALPTYPATITLTGGELAITKPLTLTGPGPDLLAVSGNRASCVFRVDKPGGANQIAVTLSGLAIRDGNASDGGGVWNDEVLMLMDAVVEDNSAARGGGMFNYHGNLVLINVTFRSNSAVFQGIGLGGGIFHWESNPVLTNVRFSGNSAEWSGGGMHNYSSSPRLINALFSGNSSDWAGGGQSNDDGSNPLLKNVVFSGNLAEWGGGIHNYRSNPSIENSILWGNHATLGGNHIYNADTASIPTITHSDVEESGGSGVNWEQSLGSDGGGNLDDDPLFVIPIDPATAPTTIGNLHVLRGSCTIDTGNNDLIPPGVSTDLDGHSRIVNGTVDMGAYEFAFHVYLPVVGKNVIP